MDKHMVDGYDQEDEVNLYDLWLVIKKRWVVMLVIGAVSLGIAVSYILHTPKTYILSNVLLLNQNIPLVEQDEITAAISVLNKMVSSEDSNLLTVFPLNREKLKDIISIKSSNIKGSKSLWIEVSVKDRQAGVDALEALPGYIFLYPGINNTIKMQKSLLQKDRDDLKAIIDNPMGAYKLSPNTSIYMPSIDLYNLKAKYNTTNYALDVIEKGQIVSLAWKTAVPKTHFKPKRGIVLLFGVSIGVVLGILSAFFMEWMERLRQSRMKA